MPKGATEVTVWVDGHHQELVDTLLSVMGNAITPLGVGGPDTAGNDLARSLKLEPASDLRKLLIDCPSAFLLVAARDGVKPADLLTAIDQGTVVLITEPPAADAETLAALSIPEAAGRIIHTPRFECSPGFLAAADPYEALGRPAQVRCSSHGQPGHGSLLSRAFDAWRIVLGFAELPETVLAFFTGAGSDPGSLKPRGMSGRLSALGRGADGAVVSLDLADDAAETRRTLHVLGPQGDLHVTDGRYTLTHRESGVTDSNATDSLGPDVPFVDLIAGHWLRLLDRPPMPANPTLDRHALACVHTMLLSARTGQPESPEQLLRTGV